MMFTGIILSGGESKRMGSDKALMSFEGKKLINYSLDVLRGLCTTLLVSSVYSEHNLLGYKVISDEYKGIGPIGGLHATLKSTTNEYNLVIPCDMPYLNDKVYKKIIDQIETEDKAIVISSKDGKIVPLVGYYHKSSLPVIEEQIANEDYKMQNLIKRLNAKMVFVNDEKALLNINSKMDLD